MIRQRQKVLNNRQLKTLYLLATDGKKTKSQLSKEFGVKYPSIHGTMRILEDKDLIKITKKEKGRGKEKLFYELTDLGIESLSKDKRITLEQFWEIAFFIFDVKTNPSIKFSVEDFFSNYEKNVLEYDLLYTPIKWSNILDNFNSLHKLTKPSPLISILYSLGSNGMMSHQDLCLYLKRTKNKNIIKSKNIQYDKSLENAVFRHLVMKIEKNNILKYCISTLGLLLLLNFLYQTKSENLTRTYIKSFNSEIRQIIKNSKIIIPQISNYWDELTDILEGHDMIRFFNWIIHDDVPKFDSIQLNGVKELLVIERIMSETNMNIIKKESRLGFKVIDKLWKLGQYPKDHPSEVYSRLCYLNMLSGYSVKNEKEFLRKTKGEKFSLDLSIENNIANRICFEFFTYFIDRINIEKYRLKQIESDDTIISEYPSRVVKRWNMFHKKHRKFKNWYDMWIEVIRKFEENNLKILKERDFLAINLS